MIDNYPTRPPKIIFLTPLFHPAIKYGPEQELKICWDHGVAQWSRRFTLAAVADIVIHLLRFPETHSQTGRRAADLWENDLLAYARVAASMCRKDAKGEMVALKDVEAWVATIKKLRCGADQAKHLEG